MLFFLGMKSGVGVSFGLALVTVRWGYNLTSKIAVVI
jgi:hypothetical protein